MRPSSHAESTRMQVSCTRSSTSAGEEKIFDARRRRSEYAAASARPTSSQSRTCTGVVTLTPLSLEYEAGPEIWCTEAGLLTELQLCFAQRRGRTKVTWAQHEAIE